LRSDLRSDRPTVFCRARALGLLALLLASSGGPASATDLSRPDAHAPIGVMGDHVHHAGEFMLSYRYMRMRMDGNREGTDRVGDGAVLLPRGDFMVTPTDMDMEMHMLGAMWAPADRVTLMGMLPFVVLSMDHETAMGAEFTTRSKGIGDLSATALVKLFETERHEVHLIAGASFPTGSIDRQDDTPASMGESVTLPYPMQLGSGTFDLLPGIHWNGQLERVSFGAQARGTLRLGRNDENYRLGHRYLLTGYGAGKINDWLSAGLRAEWQQWGDVQGEDDRLDAAMVPTADPDLRAGQRLDLGPSLNFLVPQGPLRSFRVGVEALFPVYQNLDGPQLETDWTLTAGIQFTWY